MSDLSVPVPSNMLRKSLLTFMVIGFVVGDTTDELQAISNSQLPSQEETQKLLREKCLKYGGRGAFERALNAKDELQTCVQSLVNVMELQSEMEEARPHGDLDTVFRKYCKKSPKLTECISHFTSALEPCMDEKEKETKRIIQNITEAMLGFICYKEGDRIALFIAEGGPECLLSKEEKIKTCVNQTVGKLVPERVTSLNSLPMLVLDEKECSSIRDLQECIVIAMEECAEPTPANIVESLFRFFIKMTPCEKLLANKQAKPDTYVGSSGASSAQAIPGATASLSIGVTFSFGETTYELQAIGNNLANNVPDLRLNVSQLPSPEEAEKFLREKCLKNGGEGAFERAQNAKDELKTCAQSLVNVMELQREMEEARPYGDLDTVFRKYCKKSPKLIDCISTFTSALEPCMAEKEKESKRIIQNIIEAMLGFICFKEGDRIALFIAEGGPECLLSKEEKIKTCANQTVGQLVPGQVTSLNSLPMLVLEEKECSSIVDLQKCVVIALEECAEPTPANIVDSLFKYVIKMTPCDKLLANKQATYVGSGGASSVEAIPGARTRLSIGLTFVVSDATDKPQAIGNNSSDNFPDLPINASQLPSEEHAKKVLQEKCLKYGAQNAKDELQICVQSLVNVTELQSDMDQAKPHGDLDTVFRKYCKKSPKLIECISTFTSALEPCMDEKEKESKRIIQNITEALLRFICFKDGDRIALFIVEGGLECLQWKEEEIKTCVNQTVGKLVPGQVTSLNSLPMLVFEDKECSSIRDLQKCIVTEMEECNEPTPANIVESLFRFIIKMTPCDKLLANRLAKSAAGA